MIWYLCQRGFNIFPPYKLSKLSIAMVWQLYQTGLAASHHFQTFPLNAALSWDHYQKRCDPSAIYTHLKSIDVHTYMKDAKRKLVKIGLRFLIFPKLSFGDDEADMWSLPCLFNECVIHNKFRYAIQFLVVCCAFCYLFALHLFDKMLRLPKCLVTRCLQFTCLHFTAVEIVVISLLSNII